MTLEQIVERVRREADSRTGELVDALMAKLRALHCKGKWREGCYCEFCQFLTGEYTQTKMRIRRMRRRIHRIDTWLASDWEMTVLDQTMSQLSSEEDHLHRLKVQKEHFIRKTL